jgi:hypothetical protein
VSEVGLMGANGARWLKKPSGRSVNVVPLVYDHLIVQSVEKRP